MIGFRTQVLGPADRAADEKEKGVRRAFGLMDGIIFLTLAAAFIVGVMAVAGNAMTRSAANDTVQDITNISLATRMVRNSQGYPTDIVGALRSMGQIPSNITDDDTGLINQWGGDITIDQVSGGAGFEIHYTEVPDPECKLIVLGVQSGVLRSINGEKNLTGTDVPDAQYAEDSCATGANEIYWSSILQ